MKDDLHAIDDLPEAWEWPDAGKIAQQRIKMIARMEQEPQLAQAARQVYANDPVKFIDDWGITYDPRRKPAIMPFVMFPRQRELIEWIRERDLNREDGIIEKSRDMGVTWLAVWYATWKWLFEDGTKVAFGSRKEMLVDKPGDPDSIIEKARMGIRLLPPQLQPANFKPKRDLAFCKLVNRANGASVTGEAGVNIGRGGRNSVYFIDEAAFLERPDSVEAALSANCDCKIYISTPSGPGGPFFRYRHSGRYKVFTFHWRDDPRKDEKWAKLMRDTLEPWIYAREVEIDYHAALQDVCIPSGWVHAAQKIRNFVHVPESSVGVAGLDVGVSGGAKCVYVARFGPVVLMPRHWEGKDTTTTAMIAADLAKEHGIKRLNFDEVGVGAGVAAGFKQVKDLKIFPINVGDRPTMQTWPDGKRAREKFANLKAELWWRLREKFEKTYSTYLKLSGDDKAKVYPAEDLIALPPGTYPLITELSAVRASFNQQGKIAIESKESLHKRGVASPDFAEALVLSLAPPARIAHVSQFRV